MTTEESEPKTNDTKEVVELSEKIQSVQIKEEKVEKVEEKTNSALVFHDEIELEDFEWDEEEEAWTYPCPCGDRSGIERLRVFRA